MISVGLIGKTNVGKSTFFAAATLMDVEIANRPFVTIEPNVGIAYAKKKCVHVELGVKCNPKNSLCIKDFRFIPVRLIDVAGLIPGAHEGRGLGNKFLDDLRKADVLIHVIDASGSTNEEGQPVPPGSRNPEEDLAFIETELDEWFLSIIKKDWEKFARTTDLSGKDMVEALLSKMSGVSVNRRHIIKALKLSSLENVKLMHWGEEGLRKFSHTLRVVSKPIVIAANKSDLPVSRDNIKRLQSKFKHVVPVSAESELALRRASRSGIIDYVPGEANFTILKRLDERQTKAMNYIKTNVLDVYGTTGVQDALNEAVFSALEMIAVYPVEDERKFTNRDGDVLPDVFLMEKGSTPKDLALAIHTDLGRGFLYAVDAKRRMRVGEEYLLQDNDVIKIVSSTARP
jgi:Predicted GTPase, probable translation factor